MKVTPLGSVEVKSFPKGAPRAAEVQPKPEVCDVCHDPSCKPVAAYGAWVCSNALNR